ncbi:MAG TPA: hypothetical protein VGS12_12380, partial [Caulobacteraceae bacterium]|nr:hypothetical protein [Caulobacteraceae bacterium]
LYHEPGGPLDFIEVGVIGADRGGAAAPALMIQLPSGARVEIAAGADAAMVGAILLAAKAAS